MSGIMTDRRIISQHRERFFYCAMCLAIAMTVFAGFPTSELS